MRLPLRFVLPTTNRYLQPLDLPNIPDLPQIEDVNVGSNSNTGAHNDTQPNVGAQENEYQQKEVGNGGEGTEIIDNSSGSVEDDFEN